MWVKYPPLVYNHGFYLWTLGSNEASTDAIVWFKTILTSSGLIDYNVNSYSDAANIQTSGGNTDQYANQWHLVTFINVSETNSMSTHSHTFRMQATQIKYRTKHFSKCYFASYFML